MLVKLDVGSNWFCVSAPALQNNEMPIGVDHLAFAYKAAGGGYLQNNEMPIGVDHKEMLRS